MSYQISIYLYIYLSEILICYFLVKVIALVCTDVYLFVFHVSYIDRYIVVQTLLVCAALREMKR